MTRSTVSQPSSPAILSPAPESIEGTEDETRAFFDQLIMLAEELGALPNVRLFSRTGKEQYSLIPKIIPGNVSLITIWNYKEQPSISVWRSVFEWIAPNSIESVERAIAPTKLGQGNTVYDITPKALERVKAEYREASTKA